MVKVVLNINVTFPLADFVSSRATKSGIPKVDAIKYRDIYAARSCKA